MEVNHEQILELRRQTKELKDKLQKEKEEQKAKSAGIQFVVEKHSKIYLKKPALLEEEDFDRVLVNRKFIKLSQVQDLITPETVLEQDWVTVGIIVLKSEVKKAKNNTSFIIFTLGDLEGHEIRFFLFGEAHNTWWNLPVGEVIALLNPSPFQGKDNSLSYNIEKPGMLLRIGVSLYYDKCNGFIGNKRCEGYVNIKYGRVCGLHSRPKIKSLRPELAKADFVPNKREKVGPPKKHNLPRHVYEPKPSEFTQLDRYLALRNKQSKEYVKPVEIEVNNEEVDEKIANELKRKFIEKEQNNDTALKRFKPNEI
ncbi:MCM10 [Blepharisma stoltei]|uniref:MCM10 OB-fold domain-containing protein n=1 Tax=Blepharisma stoltei TaxID=1481888 RepID=A0AAU9IHH8_9CILI|nr:unnamed protein product [Blepharisma stoltei]